MTKFTMEEKEAVLRALYEKGSKNEQDVYLHGLMECKPVVRKRPNKEARENSGQRVFLITYENL
ncbi:unnamed protein product [Acanthoscelides obtectus]|nr:unnamed protein product [Acanthoscelides obtectus]CAK1645313.1 hypothetical protein AOBTE_LOCUS14079 [Acanthoscelides obtectus]